MRKRGQLHVLVTLLAFATACGNDGGGTGPIPIDNFVTEFEAAFCAFYVGCGELPDQASCAASLGEGSSAINRIVTAVRAGRVIYHGDEARRCLNAITTLRSTCSNTALIGNGEYVRACTATFVGTLADGATCTDGTECRSGSCPLSDPQCDRDTTCCTGTCATTRTQVAVGGDCSSSATVCATGAYCKADTMTGMRTCQPQVGAGGACTTSIGCTSGLLCVNGKCGTLPAEGQDCATINTCDRFDNYCDATTRLCTHVKPVGSTCAAERECAGFAYCDMNTMKCGARVRVGEACSTTGVRCLTGLDCTNGTCAVPPPGPSCP